jgi:hypothetical protein
MIVQGTRLPTFDELIAVLKRRFPNHSVYLFDSKPQKSIIVRKSALVGAQITLRENEMIVDACCPNIFISALIGLISTIFPQSNYPIIHNIRKKKSLIARLCAFVHRSSVSLFIRFYLHRG